MDITQGRIVLMAVLPMPPSTNALHNPVVRRKKARSVFEEDKIYAGKRVDPAVIAYELQLRTILNYPRNPWRSLQDKELIKEIKDNPKIKLDLELYEYFTNDKSDIDNRIKAFQDMLARYLEIDDKRFIDGHQHKRVHKECIPCIVATLRIATIPDIWQEQAELDDLIERYRNEEKIAEDRIVFN